ncbi:hypothetical protein BY458DRAFT_521941 [Sporodiniella umbellata]|nr:hypothetical protein BY458DRAFT_521941 [Sporodiniella umbellata]
MLWIVIREMNPASRMGYSKFEERTSGSSKIASRQGMLLIYMPSLFLSIGLFCLHKSENLAKESHVQLLSLLLVFHYTKRVIEVIFVHSYSGYCNLKDSLRISSCYFGYALFLVLWTVQVPTDRIRLSLIKQGLGLFVLGESINGYHHWLLRSLRAKGSREYKIPYQGLFNYVWCPHYVRKYRTQVDLNR